MQRTWIERVAQEGRMLVVLSARNSSPSSRALPKARERNLGNGNGWRQSSVYNRPG